MYKPNVLHVIDTLGVGGAEKLLVGVVNSLPQFNHHVILLSGTGSLMKELPPDSPVSSLNFKSKWDIPRSVMALRKYIKRNNIEIVHSHLVMSTLIARLACPRRVQLFNTIHNLLSHRCFANSKRLQRITERITYRKRHHIIAVSEEVYKDYDRCIGIKGKATVLHNFVEGKFFQTDYKRMSFNGTFRMVAVGSFKEQKNYPYMVEAFKNLPKGIHLDIYGDGPLRKDIEKIIKEHNLNIKLCGIKGDMHSIIPKYDMYIMTSTFEGHPVALLEAMACGMPAVVSDIPVLREATGNYGIFCDLDNINDFVNKVKAIAAHEVDLDVYAKSNFERAKQLGGKENYMQKLAAMYITERPAQRKPKTERQPVPVFRQALPAATS